MSVVDAKLGLSDVIPTLAVGATATYNLSYGPVTESDLPGPIVNTATADSDETSSVSDGHSVNIVTSPAITVDKTAPAGPYTVGQTITYSFVVTNAGDVTLSGISISDPLVGLSAITGYATTLAPGASTTGTATYVVTQADVDRGSLVNTATVQGTPPVGTPVGDTDGHTVTFIQNPALAIVKTGDLGPVTIGDTVQYTIAVSNVGNVTLHNVTVADPKLGFTDTLATLGVGLTATYNRSYGPVTESDLPGPIVNTATADSDETTSVSDGHSVDVHQPIDLSLTETVNTSHPAVGDIVTFTVTLSNAMGMAPATGVSVRHVLGAGFEFVSSTPSLGLYSAATGTWTVGSLASGQSATLEVQVRVLPQGPFKSAAEVSSADQQDVDSTPANAVVTHEDDDGAAAVTPPSADLSIQKTAGNATPSVGDFVDFSLVVANLGPDPATGIVADDILPTGITYLTDDGSGAYNPASGRWTVGDLAVGATAALRLTVRVDEGTLGLTIENTAIAVPGMQVDPDLSNNRASATVHIPAADLQIVKNVDDDSPDEGETVEFTIELTNLGPDTALAIGVADLLPAGLTYVRHSGGGGYDPILGAWAVGALAAARSVVLHVWATVDLGTAGSQIVNIAAVTGSSLPDPDLTNNRDEATVAVGGGGGGGGAGGCTGRVIINEVAWVGTAADPERQWMELRNVGTEDVDLAGWTLRWRKKAPVTQEDLIWKDITLAGVLKGAGTSACQLALLDSEADIEFMKRVEDNVSWLVTAESRDDDGSYLVIERKTDETVRNVAGIVYDEEKPYRLNLSMEGDILQLVDAAGAVVDTANAFESASPDWPAGDPATFGTMERTDPLAPDAADNWHTNLGVVTRGEDAEGRPLVATAGALNSEPLAEWTLYARMLEPTPAAAGTRFEVALDLTQAARLATGWPWIRVTEPTADAAGGGAQVESTYAFSSRTLSDGVVVTIDTTGMAPGRHLVWIVFAERKAILVPITIVP